MMIDKDTLIGDLSVGEFLSLLSAVEEEDTIIELGALKVKSTTTFIQLVKEPTSAAYSLQAVSVDGDVVYDYEELSYEATKQLNETIF